VQVWNNNPSPWQYDPDLYYDEPSPVSFTATLDSNAQIPITKHAMVFQLAEISGAELQPDGSYVETTYSADDIADMADVSKQALLLSLVSFDATTESNGVYSSNITVTGDYTFLVDTVVFDVVDNSCFDENGEG
jgi:hypothetical protein